MALTINVLCYAGYTALSVLGLLLLKATLPRLGAPDGWSMQAIAPVGLGAAIYAASFALWLVILARQPLSVAYPIAIGLTLAFSSMAASWQLHEALPMARIAGIALVFVGVAVIARS